TISLWAPGPRGPALSTGAISPAVMLGMGQREKRLRWRRRARWMSRRLSARPRATAVRRLAATSAATSKRPPEVDAAFLAGPCAEIERKRRRHLLERAALGADAEAQLYQRRRHHQRRARGIAGDDRAVLDEDAEKPGAADAAQERAEGVEERDGKRAQLQGKALADREIGGARR